ncbi:MAG: 16S rRNA (cytosine(1402)-N(4))-methyltransferase RsmH [Planctomycetes bacterium]|nr:16S rRNA (cytosine(1402)-N(4))-methyltransferase RsmH [Planctomycetota bacterium]
MPESEKPRRRKRYAGTHPRGFHEKYKELDPARFPAEQTKVRAQGRTPAGTHVSIMLSQVMEALSPQPGQIALDCTLGYGGHASMIAAQLSPGGRLIGIDLDKPELQRTTSRLKNLGLPVTTRHTNFAGIGNVLAAEQLTGVDMLMADLGVSSMQLDRPERGFAFKHDAPLDMRLDPTRGKTAADYLRGVSEKDLAQALRDFGDEPHADKIAAAIKLAPPTRTHELAYLVLKAKGLDMPNHRRKSAFDAHPAARVFQALRIAVNHELETLDQLLRLLPHVLNAGGRAAIITFHSGEDSRVEAAFAKYKAEGLFSEIGGPIAPSPGEIHDNPRARSAKLRWALRAL